MFNISRDHRVNQKHMNTSTGNDDNSYRKTQFSTKPFKKSKKRQNTISITIVKKCKDPQSLACDCFSTVFNKAEF